MKSLEKEILYKEKEKNIHTYDILRVFATLLVILSHCGYYNILTKYGGISYGEEINLIYGDTLIHIFFSRIVKLIYTFHMPLFIALSGALFYIQIKNDKYKSINSLITNKAKRLLIPFIVITLIYSVPIKYISGYFKSSNNLLKDILFGQILIQGNTYLWFLPTLFLVFIIIYLSEKYIDISSNYKIIILIFLNILSYNMPVMIVKYVFRYIIWFYFGFLFESLRKKIDNKLEIYKNSWLFIVFVILMLYVIKDIKLFSNRLLLKIIEKLIILIIGVAECFLMYILSFKLTKCNIYNKCIFKQLLITSFGLYLYSDPINYLILHIVYKIGGMTMFISEIGSLSIIVLRAILTLFIAFFITKVLKSKHIKYIV